MLIKNNPNHLTNANKIAKTDINFSSGQAINKGFFIKNIGNDIYYKLGEEEKNILNVMIDFCGSSFLTEISFFRIKPLLNSKKLNIMPENILKTINQFEELNVVKKINSDNIIKFKFTDEFVNYFKSLTKEEKSQISIFKFPQQSSNVSIPKPSIALPIKSPIIQIKPQQQKPKQIDKPEIHPQSMPPSTFPKADKVEKSEVHQAKKSSSDNHPDLNINILTPFIARVEKKINSDPKWAYLELKNHDKMFLKKLKTLEPDKQVSLNELVQGKKLKSIKLRQLIVRMKHHGLIKLENSKDNTDTLISVTDEFVKIVKLSVYIPEIKKKSVLPSKSLAEQKHPTEKKINPDVKPLKNISAKKTPFINKNCPMIEKKHRETNMEKIARLINSKPDGSYTELSNTEKTFITRLLNLETNNPVGVRTVCKREKISFFEVKDLVVKLKDKGLIKLQSSENGPTVFLSTTENLHQIPDPSDKPKTELKSGFLLFESKVLQDLWGTDELTQNSTLFKLIKKQLMSKNEDLTDKISFFSLIDKNKTIIKFDKNKPGIISSILDSFSKMDFPSVLICSKKSQSRGLDLKGINTYSANYIEDIKPETINSEFVKKNGFTEIQQKILNTLYYSDEISNAELLDQICMSSSEKFIDAIKELDELNIIEKRNLFQKRFSYKLTDNFREKIKQNLTTEDEIKELIKTITLE